MSAPFQLGFTAFRTKTEVERTVREILHGTTIGTPVDESHRSFLLDLLGRHPRANAKIGVGVDYFWVRRAPKYSTRCFYVRRLDGSDVEFSTKECLTPSTPYQQFQQACREAVMAQTVTFRDLHFGPSGIFPCSITGALLSKETAHVDHWEPTFIELVDGFLKLRNINIHDVLLTGHEDGATKMRFADESIRLDWQNYHHQHARLRITSKQANLARKRKP